MTIFDLLRELSIECREHGEDIHVTQGWIGIKCPQCSSHSFRCGINIRKLNVTCWVCGKLKIGETLSAASGRPLRDVLRLLGQISSWMTFDEPQHTKASGTYTPPPGVGELLPVHRKYLQKRHLDPDAVADTWKVQGIGPDSTHPWRIFIPVHLKKKPVTWTSRHCGNSPLRYLSAEPSEQSVDLKATLLGEDFVGNVVCVVEGPLDAIRVGPGCVCTYGTAFSEIQVCRIAKYPKRVVCFDPDSPGRIAAENLCRLLEIWPGETLNVELSTGDPGDAADWEIQELRRMLL